MHNPAEAKRILEAVLLASQEPLGVAELRRLFDDEVSAETLRHLLTELGEEWNGRAVELVSLASGWRVQTRAEFRPYVERLFPRKAAALLPRRHGNARHHRLPPAGDPRRYRGHPRRDGFRPDHPDAGEPRLDRRRRPARDAGAAGALRFGEH